MTRLAFALVILLALPSCTASNFSSLQSAFLDVQQARITCSQKAQDKAPDTAQALMCSGSDRPVLLDIAQQADKAASDRGDPRTRIGLYRLAATAGWESRLPEGLSLASDARAEGMRLCASLPAQSFGAPRDCALLAVTDVFVAHERALNVLDPLEGKAGPEVLQTLGEVHKTYIPNTLLAMESERAKLNAAELDPVLLAYFDRQRLGFICTLQKIGALYRRAGAATEAGEIAGEFRDLRQRFHLTDADQCP